jgi:hypothetical protein
VTGRPDEDHLTNNAEADPLQDAARDLAARLAEYELVRDSDEYQAQHVFLQRLTQDFVLGIRSAWIAFTRYPEAEKWLLQSFTDDMLESAVAVLALAEQGVFNVCRRELRYMLEAAVKYVYVDQQVPGDTPLSDRLNVVADQSRVPRSSVDPIEGVTLRMLMGPPRFVASVHSAFGLLSGYTHVSQPQLEERLRRVERGEFSGFESAATLSAFNRVVRRVYDLVLTLVFEGVGPAFAGDLFVQVFDPRTDWKFHKGEYVREVSSFFDYKAERQRP